MKLLSWNVNGIRAVMRKGAMEAVEAERPDVLCLQETKASAAVGTGLALPYPHQYWAEATSRKGYAGTAVLARVEPLRVTTGLGLPQHDDEGRLITAEFEAFFLVNCYTPNAQSGLKRLDYRTAEWDKAFREHLIKLDEQKPVLACGDLNVAHQEIDIANPKSNRRNPGFTDEERASFTQTLESGFSDTFRVRHPGEAGHYTWWTMRTNARERNIGWRLDYWLASHRLEERIERSWILNEIYGSDHCPVGIEVE